MIKNRTDEYIKNNSYLLNSFLNAKINNLKINCKILSGNFSLDSFNFFPITEKKDVFLNLFYRNSENSVDHYMTEKFEKKFDEKIKSFKSFDNVFVLGSNPADNYYSNLLFFLPRLFFTHQKNIKIIIHRNLSNKFRNLISEICKKRNIEYTFSFIDDDFYTFNNSLIPQFLNLNDSISILNFFLNINTDNEKKKKLFIRREDSVYRKLINEADVISLLKKNGYTIINPQQYTINEQIELFADAQKIVAPMGSSLANLVFCKAGTEVVEIAPLFKNKNETIVAERYKNLCKICSLNYRKIIAETVDVKVHSKLAEKYISKAILQKSSYYKNLIVQMKQIEKLI